MYTFVAAVKSCHQNEVLTLSDRYITKYQPPSGSNRNWITSNFVVSDSEMTPTEDDKATAFDDISTESGNNSDCDKVVT